MKSQFTSAVKSLWPRTMHCILEALTHWGRDEINNISQMTFSNVFSSLKMFEFRLKFHWSLFPRVQSTIFQHWFRWLGAVQATSHHLNQWWLVYRRIYASLGLNELKTFNSSNNVYKVRKMTYHFNTGTCFFNSRWLPRWPSPMEQRLDCC